MRGGEKARLGLNFLQWKPLQYVLAECKGLAFVLNSVLVLAVQFPLKYGCFEVVQL